MPTFEEPELWPLCLRTFDLEAEIKSFLETSTAKSTQFRVFNYTVAHPKGLELRWSEDRAFFDAKLKKRKKQESLRIFDATIHSTMQPTLNTWNEFHRFYPGLDLVKLPTKTLKAVKIKDMNFAPKMAFNK